MSWIQDNASRNAPSATYFNNAYQFRLDQVGSASVLICFQNGQDLWRISLEDFIGNPLLPIPSVASMNAAIAAAIAGVTSVFGRSYGRLSALSGWGGTNTKIPRFTTPVSLGTDVTIQQSAADGDSILCNVTGGYLVEGEIISDDANNPASVLTVNAVDFTTDPYGNSIAGTICRQQSPVTALTGNAAPLSRIALLTAGDVVRIHGRGSNTAFPTQSYFSVTRAF